MTCARSARVRPPSRSAPARTPPPSVGTWGSGTRFRRPPAHAWDRTSRPRPRPRADNRIVGSNAISLAAMGRAAPEARVHDEPLVGRRVRRRRPGFWALPPGLHLLGGETTVRVTGAGTGGRNQELALRVAMGLRPGDVFPERGHRRPRRPHRRGGRGWWTMGRSDGSGWRGLDPEALLADNDAHRALGGRRRSAGDGRDGDERGRSAGDDSSR